MTGLAGKQSADEPQRVERLNRLPVDEHWLQHIEFDPDVMADYRRILEPFEDIVGYILEIGCVEDIFFPDPMNARDDRRNSISRSELPVLPETSEAQSVEFDDRQLHNLRRCFTA